MYQYIKPQDFDFEEEVPIEELHFDRLVLWKLSYKHEGRYWTDDVVEYVWSTTAPDLRSLQRWYFDRPYGMQEGIDQLYDLSVTLAPMDSDGEYRIFHREYKDKRYKSRSF